MKRLFCCFLAMVICILFTTPVVYGAWKEKVTRNQVNVLEYVEKLRAGGKPEKLERPHLRRDDHYKAKQSQKELAKIMNDAEELARAGKHDLIAEPQFKIKGLSDDRAVEMFGLQPAKGD